MKQTTNNNLHFALVAVHTLIGFGFLAFAVTSKTFLEAVAYAGLGFALLLIGIGLYIKYQAEGTLPQDLLEE